MNHSRSHASALEVCFAPPSHAEGAERSHAESAEDAEYNSHAENAESAEVVGRARSPSGPQGGASPPGEPPPSERGDAAGTAAGGSIPWAATGIRSLSPVSTNFYAYDARGQVTNVAFSSSSDAYAYDSIGNRLSSSDRFGTRLYDANAVNQYEFITNISSSAAAEPEYDLDGNLVSDGLFEYEWDARGRLIGAFGETPEGRPLELLYEYDWRNRLTGKRRRVHAASGSWSEEWHEYLWDDWLLLHERIERPDGTVSNLEFVWGRDLSDTFHGAGGVGGLVAVSLDGYYYVPAYDDNGNVIAYFDESGAFAARYEYDAFGNVLASSGPLADALPHRFSTKYFDPDTGLYYYGHRWYSPELGRWISRDPVGENAGYNLLSFCCNDSLCFLDSLGETITVIATTYVPNTFGRSLRKLKFPTADELVEEPIAEDLKNIEPEPMSSSSAHGVAGIRDVTVRDNCTIWIRIDVKLNVQLAINGSSQHYHYSPHYDAGTITTSGGDLVAKDSLPISRDLVFSHELGHVMYFKNIVFSMLETRLTLKYPDGLPPRSSALTQEINDDLDDIRRSSGVEDSVLSNMATRNWLIRHGFQETKVGNGYEYKR